MEAASSVTEGVAAAMTTTTAGVATNSNADESRFKGRMLEINRDGYAPRVRVCVCVTMVYVRARAVVAMASWLVQRVVLSPGG